MTSASKLLVVLLVLCGGVGAALLFRKEHPGDNSRLFHMEAVETTCPFPVSVDGHLALRHAPDEVPSYVAEGWPTPRSRAATLLERNASTTPNQSLIPRQQPNDKVDKAYGGAKPLHPLAPIETPTLPSQFPVADKAGNTARPVFGSVFFREGRASDDKKAETEPPSVHRVVDGDTLVSLAERFLGSADRAAAIYELNRDRLDDPDMLPIGVELRLPARDSSREPVRTDEGVPVYDAVPRTQLVPIDTE